MLDLLGYFLGPLFMLVILAAARGVRWDWVVALVTLTLFVAKVWALKDAERRAFGLWIGVPASVAALAAAMWWGRRSHRRARSCFRPGQPGSLRGARGTGSSSSSSSSTSS